MIESIHVHDLSNNKVDLMAKYKNKPLLIIFYNNQCLGCTGRAIPLAYEFQKKHNSLQVIGIHSNFNNNDISKEDILSIFTIKELPFPIYLDKNHQEYDKFNCEGTPQWLLITKEGEIFRSIFGSQQGAQNRLLYAIDNLLAE